MASSQEGVIRVHGQERIVRDNRSVLAWGAILKVGMNSWRLILLCTLALVPAVAQELPAVPAQALLEEGKPESALPILLNLQRASPTDPNLCQQIGIAYTQLNNLVAAVRYYRKAIQLNPRFHAARKNLGTVLWFLNRRDEAEREFLIVAKALPGDPVPHLYLGLADAERHQFEHAKEEFERAGALALDNPEVIPPVLESYLASRDVSFPTTVLDRLTRAESPDAAILSHAGALFLQYGHPEQAITALERIVSVHNDSAETWRTLGEAYDREGKPDDAHRAYEHAIEMDPNSEESYLSLADFASAHANNDYALQVIKRGLERLPQSSLLRFERGILLALIGNRTEAQASFLQANRLKPDWKLPLLALGVSELEAGNAAQAAVMFQRARARDSHDPRAWYLYALALSKQDTGDVESTRARAVAALRKAIEIDPDDANSHALLGRLELDMGNTGAASRQWETALKLDPDNATALYQLSLLYRKEAKRDEAQQLAAKLQQLKAKQRAGESQLVEILKVVPQRPPR